MFDVMSDAAPERGLHNWRAGEVAGNSLDPIRGRLPQPVELCQHVMQGNLNVMRDLRQVICPLVLSSTRSADGVRTLRFAISLRVVVFRVQSGP